MPLVSKKQEALFYMSLRTISIIVVTLVCIVSALLLIVPEKSSGVTIALEADIPSQTEYWTAYIQEHGAARSYAAFSAWVAPASVSQQHTLAHVIGGALYTVAGIDGLSVCTGEFSYGCYHEFLGQAIHKEGLAIIATLSDICVDALDDQALGCQHGIGHGIAGYLGYDLGALTEALDVCEQLPTDEFANGCSGGVFMEYNLQTLLTEQGAIRAYDKAHGWQYPCDALDGSRHATCYFWQTQWWQSVSMPGYLLYADKATRMGDWCDALPDRHVARECFRGIGNNAPGVLGYDPADVIRVCDSMPASDGIVECRAGAAGALLATVANRPVGYTVCDGLAPEQHEYCVNTATVPH